MRTGVVLTLEATKDASLREALRDAIKVSQVLDVPVTLIFNQAHLPLNGGDSVETLAACYDWACLGYEVGQSES